MKLAESIIEDLWFAEDTEDESTTEAAESFAAALGKSTGLKTFPAVAQKILSIVSNDYYRTADVARALEEDPSLAAGILRVANSAFFANTKAVSSVQQALVRVGVNQVKEIVYSVATMGMFKDVGGFGSKIRDHCASTAALVQYIAREVAPRYVDGIFLCGLLHDIGKLLLIDSGEIDYPVDDLEKAMEPNTLHLFEREDLGYDHAVLAGHIVAAWNMEAKLSKIVAWHHQPTRAYKEEEVGQMVALLRLADKIDFHLSLEEEDSDPFIKSLCESTDGQLIGLKQSWMSDNLADLYRLRLESLTMFSGK